MMNIHQYVFICTAYTLDIKVQPQHIARVISFAVEALTREFISKTLQLLGICGFVCRETLSADLVLKSCCGLL